MLIYRRWVYRLWLLCSRRCILVMFFVSVIGIVSTIAYWDLFGDAQVARLYNYNTSTHPPITLNSVADMLANAGSPASASDVTLIPNIQTSSTAPSLFSSSLPPSRLFRGRPFS